MQRASNVLVFSGFFEELNKTLKLFICIPFSRVRTHLAAFSYGLIITKIRLCRKITAQVIRVH